MRPLKIQRFLQDPAHCSVAAASSIANRYNKNVEYITGKAICKKFVTNNTDDGLYTGEIGLLLNYLGFKKVTIVSSDTGIYDYSWKKHSSPNLTKELHKFAKTRGVDKETKLNAKASCNFLDNSSKNKIIIDYRFAKYIRDYLDNGVPIILSFNFTMFFNLPKYGSLGPDPIQGYAEHHAVVARGYNKTGVHIVDSHYEYYKYRLKRFREGYYVFPWEDLLTTMGEGDLIVPESFDLDCSRSNCELV